MNLMAVLRVPAGFIAANFAGLLSVLSVVGAVPGLAGNARVMADFDEHADSSGMVVLRQLRHTTLRDLPVTLALWTYVVVGIATVLLVNGFDAGTRVFFAGVLVPVYWVAGGGLGAYVRAAGTLPYTATRGEVTDAAVALVLRSPVRALLTVVAVLVTTPIWALAPITIACGISLPAWVIGKVWGPVHGLRSDAATADPDEWVLQPAPAGGRSYV